MIIQHNMRSIFLERQLNKTSSKREKNMERLSSGRKLNRSSDDTAGVAISEKMRAQIRGLNMGSKNSQDAVSFTQYADASMNEMHDMLNRARELCIQAASDVNDKTDKAAINLEVEGLKKEILEICDKAMFNDIFVFKEGNREEGEGSAFGSGLTLVMGAKNVSQVIKLSDTVTFGSGWQSTNTLVPGSTYACAWLDFNGAGLDYPIGRLYGEGFNSTCATCSNHYNIKLVNGEDFTDQTQDGVKYSYVPSSTSPRLEVDISDCLTGEDIVNNIMSAISASPEMRGHFTQYAVNPNDPTKMYILDNRPSTVTGTNNSSFEPVVRNSAGFLDNIKDKWDAIWIQTGANRGNGVWMEKPILDESLLGISGVDASTQSNASDSIGLIDTASKLVSKKRTLMGAYNNRFEYNMKVNDVSAENLQSSESVIRDVDMAKEMTAFTKNQILSQTGTAMMAQANSLPQSVLQLLNG